MPTAPVFYDPSGRRRKVVSRLAIVAGLTAAVASTLFALSLLALPVLPGTPKKKHFLIPNLPKYDQRQAEAILQKTKRELHEEIKQAKPKTTKQNPKSGKLAVAFYAPWQQAGLASFEKHASKLTHIAPAWLSLSDKQELDFRDFDLTVNPNNNEVIKIARRNGVAIMPVLANSFRGGFDKNRLIKLLTNEESQKKLIEQIRQWLVAMKFDGINIDFELLPDNLRPQYIAFLSDLKKALTPDGKTVSADLEAVTEPKQAEEVADAVDWTVVMLYDEHSQVDEPGPVASLTWSTKTLEDILKVVPEEKVVVGLGNYAYDWIKGSPATSLTFEDAMATAAGYRDEDKPQDVIEIDPESVNPRFDYTDDQNRAHKVWMLDGVTAYNQWEVAQDMGVRGVGLWVLGTEDPSVWSFLDRATLDRAPSAKGLNEIRFSSEVDFVGKGEILNVKARPQDGKREVFIDPDVNQAFNWQYDRYAFPFVLQKRGYTSKKLVLTFDDGPDPTYTAPILDELKRLGVPGTFFLIGQNAEQYPGLVRRIFRDGNEIGNHSFTHPNLGTVSPRRAMLELNATQRAIESITGRSTILFRPPYNADSQPQTPEQVTPVEIADNLHYVTVEENIDPQDWETNLLTPDGAVRKKTAEDIANYVLRDVQRREGTDDEGNIILLHDAGGDRQATVDALRLFVPELQRRGYQFVRVGDLIGSKESEVMPPIPPSEAALVGLDQAVFTIYFWTERILTLAFIGAIGLGLGRSILITVLAWVSRRRRSPDADRTPRLHPSGLEISERSVSLADAERVVAGFGPRPETPSVSVIIAAYNEGAVIQRTIESILKSDYPLTEIIVVDDGSTDNTSAAVREIKDDKIKLIKKENGGKASALNLAIESAMGEILFCVDADTQIAPDAIRLLAKHFENSNVAAAAGNVKVGNADNLLTRWQALEYTTSQNVDRRAYGLLNCITVVPGAIGAWRREAIVEVGGYRTDTLAEDMDLTWRLRTAGYKLENEPRALAFTEAPEDYKGFIKQRFRWAFGTLQCLVKHRGAIAKHGWFGWFALPTLWLFQVVFQVLAPLIDLKVLFTVVSVALALLGDAGGSLELRSSTGALEQLTTVALLYGLFFMVELIAAWLAYRWDNARKSDLWFLFLQRFFYRQTMYAVVLKSLWRAATGGRQIWGKLPRTGTVRAG